MATVNKFYVFVIYVFFTLFFNGNAMSDQMSLSSLSELAGCLARIHKQLSQCNEQTKLAYEKQLNDTADELVDSPDLNKRTKCCAWWEAHRCWMRAARGHCTSKETVLVSRFAKTLSGQLEEECLAKYSEMSCHHVAQLSRQQRKIATANVSRCPYFVTSVVVFALAVVFFVLALVMSFWTWAKNRQINKSLTARNSDPYY